MTAAEAATLLRCARNTAFGERCGDDPELWCTTCQVLASYAALEAEVESLRREVGTLRRTCSGCNGTGVAPERVPTGGGYGQRYCSSCGGAGLAPERET